MNRLFAYFTVAATLLFAIAVVALLFLAPEIDPTRFGISFYALTKFAPLIALGLVLVGLSGLSIAVCTWHATGTVLGRIGLVLLIAWGISSILAGAFPLDPPGAPPTMSGTIHNMAGLNFLLVAPAVLLLEPSRSGGRRRTTYWLAWGLVAAALLLFTFNGPLFSLGIGGLVQRLYWLVLSLWLIAKATAVLGGEEPTL